MAKHGEGVRNAVNKFYEREAKKQASPKRKNSKPEKLVERAVMSWLKERGFSCHVYEAKAKFLPGKGYTWRTPIPVGHTDIGGVNRVGIGIYVELKAPGRISALRDEQREFIINKIDNCCFSCVVDSVDSLECIYDSWADYWAEGDVNGAKMFLMECLPKQKKRAEKTDDGFPF